MSVDKDTVRRIAKLSGLAIQDDLMDTVAQELGAILQWAAMLSEVDVSDVPGISSGASRKLKMRNDRVTDGGVADILVANAPEQEGNCFVVPKVID